jgi:hypothetical protein
VAVIGAVVGASDIRNATAKFRKVLGRA